MYSKNMSAPGALGFCEKMDFWTFYILLRRHGSVHPARNPQEYLGT